VVNGVQSARYDHNESVLTVLEVEALRYLADVCLSVQRNRTFSTVVDVQT
jgi:hypothetical protein